MTAGENFLRDLRPSMVLHSKVYLRQNVVAVYAFTSKKALEEYWR